MGGARTDPSRSGVVPLPTGVRTAYLEWGTPDALPVVLLHPWLESGDTFSLMRPHLVSHPASRMRVLAPDQRGHGSSSVPAGGYELPGLAADVVAFLDATGVGSALLVGASSGGYVAQQVAATAPDRVAGLVLAGAPRSLRGRTPPFAGELADLRDPIDESWARSFVAGFVAPGVVEEGFLDARVRDALAVPADVWRESLAALVRSQPPASDSIRAPTLVVSGAQDALLGRQDARDLARTIPGARWVEYDGAGHVLHWERPERLAADVVAFAVEMAESRA